MSILLLDFVVFHGLSWSFLVLHMPVAFWVLELAMENLPASDVRLNQCEIARNLHDFPTEKPFIVFIRSVRFPFGITISTDPITSLRCRRSSRPRPPRRLRSGLEIHWEMDRTCRVLIIGDEHPMDFQNVQINEHPYETLIPWMIEHPSSTFPMDFSQSYQGLIPGISSATPCLLCGRSWRSSRLATGRRRRRPKESQAWSAVEVWCKDQECCYQSEFLGQWI